MPSKAPWVSKRASKLLIFIVLGVFLSGCADLARSGQEGATGQILLSEEQPVGQTFVAGNAGLNGVQIFIRPELAGDGILQLHLRPAPDAEEDLAVSQRAAASVARPGYTTFSFPPQPGSRLQYYYALLTLKGSGRFQVSSAPGDTYLNGSAYAGHEPLDAQLTFRLTYDLVSVIAGLAREGLEWAGILCVGLFVFVLPGWALLALVFSGWGRLAWMEKLGLSAGISLALYPLFILWTGLIGLRLGALYAWLPPVAGGLLLVWRKWRERFRRPTADGRPLGDFGLHKEITTFQAGPGFASQFYIKLKTAVSGRPSAVDLSLLAVLALLAFTRFWPVRSLDAPMWGDSYQHTVIAKLFLDHNGLFESWQPYADLVTFTYHFGFHSAAAVFSWITGAAAPSAVLWTGQLLNILAVIALYPLILKATRQPWAGVAGLVVAGLLAPMPMAYVNWGRYTQLAGQVILPAFIVCAWVSLERTGKERRPVALAALALGGLALTHLRVLLIGLAFLPAYLLSCLRKEAIRNWVTRVFWIGAGAGLLFLPWFLRTFSGKIIAIFSSQISTPASQITSYGEAYNQIGDLLSYLPAVLWLLLPLAFGWSLWRREKGVVLTGLWWFLVLLITNPNWLGLPGLGSISNFTIFIAIYIPAGVMLGAAASWIINSLSELYDRSYPSPRAAQVLAFIPSLALVALGVWGARQRLGDVQIMAHSLVGRPDVRAAGWIQDHTPQDARFLVNSFPAFDDTSIVGSDGGWWLPIFAGRRTNLPPLNYGFEQGPRPDYQAWINKLYWEISTNGISHPDTLALLEKRKITYIYIGQQQGQVNHPDPTPLDPQTLLASPAFTPVYHQDRVWVFAITPQR